MVKLTHFDGTGKVKMVDVTEKKTTKRVAIATGVVRMERKTLDLVESNRIIKGDVLAVAKIAGIMAAKKVSELIPLTHPIRITGCDIDFAFLRRAGSSGIKVTATVRTKDATGCEMEALSCVAITCLTIYDMCKAVEKGMVIEDICLLEKRGGKSGTYMRRKSMDEKFEFS